MKHPKLQRPDTVFGQTTPGGLYNQVSDKQQTQLAYKLSYYPPARLSQEAKRRIVWHASMLLTKAQILQRCTVDLTKIDWPLEESKPFQIHWEYNNIPTEAEWNKFPETAMFYVDYRISPLIKAGEGRVCVIGIANRG
jgi:hypothetical protein